MFTQEEYLSAWAVYTLGAVLLMAFWWFITGKIRLVEPRYLLRIVFAVFLAVPWYTKGTDGYLSPAWLISIIEGAFEGGDAFWRAGTPLVTAILVAVIASSVVYLALWFKARHSSKLDLPNADD